MHGTKKLRKPSNNTVRYISRQRASIVGSAMAGSTLQLDSGHKNKKIGSYPKCLRPFLRILCDVSDSI